MRTASEEFLAAVHELCSRGYSWDRAWSTAKDQTHKSAYQEMMQGSHALANENEAQRRRREAIEKFDRELRITTDYKGILDGGPWTSWPPNTIRGKRAVDVFGALADQMQKARPTLDYNTIWRECQREYSDIYAAMSVPILPAEKNEAHARPDLTASAIQATRGRAVNTPARSGIAGPPHIVAALGNEHERVVADAMAFENDRQKRLGSTALSNAVADAANNVTHWSRLVPQDLIKGWSDADKLNPRGRKAAAIISALLNHYASEKQMAYDHAFKLVSNNYPSLLEGQRQIENASEPIISAH